MPISTGQDFSVRTRLGRLVGYDMTLTSVLGSEMDGASLLAGWCSGLVAR